MYELGIVDDFLMRPHQEVRQLKGQIGNETIAVADFTHLPTHCKFLGLMPQWDFLDFIVEQARRYPSFHLKMQAEVTDLLEEDGRVVGVRARSPEGMLEVRADLTIGADGRHSVVRERAGLSVLNLGAPMDVLWMRVSRQPTDPAQTFGRFDTGRILVFLNREDYWQVAYVIPKGKADELRQQGLPAFRQELVRLAPFLENRVEELRDWDDIKLLTVAVDRLRRWFRPGLLCIGDAAHAMSPIGGVGINLAIQDAVATANILGERLRLGTVNEGDLAGGAATKDISHARHPAAAINSAEQCDPQSAGHYPAAHAALACKAPGAVEVPAAHSGAGGWAGISSGTCEDARSSGSIVETLRSRPGHLLFHADNRQGLSVG